MCIQLDFSSLMCSINACSWIHKSRPLQIFPGLFVNKEALFKAFFQFLTLSHPKLALNYEFKLNEFKLI